VGVWILVLMLADYNWDHSPHQCLTTHAEHPGASACCAVLC
jgi:hypothetical protein